MSTRRASRSRLSAETQPEMPDLEIERKTLHQLYTNAQNVTSAFQKSYDILKSQESILYTLRDKYYEALATKKYHENERDIYFDHDKHILDIRRQLIDRSVDILQEQRAYYTASQSYHNNITDTVRNRDRKIRQHEAKIHDLTTNLTHLEEQYVERGQELQTVKTDLLIAKETAEQHKKAAELSELQARCLQKKLTEQEAQTDRFKKTAERLHTQLEQAEKSIADLDAVTRTQAGQIEQYEDLIKQQNELQLDTEKELADLDDRFKSLTEKTDAERANFQNQVKELEEKVDEYTEKIKAQITELDMYKGKCSEMGVRLDNSNKKYENVKRDRERALSKEFATRRENVEVNERYHALLERAMALLESDSNKNVQLQMLISDNIRLCHKRTNTPMRPKTQEALRRAEDQVDFISKKQISSARRKMRNPGTLLKTAKDINTIGFLDPKNFNFTLKPYRAMEKENSEVWDTTRVMKWNTRQGHTRMTPGSSAKNKRVVNLIG